MRRGATVWSFTPLQPPMSAEARVDRAADGLRREPDVSIARGMEMHPLRPKARPPRDKILPIHLCAVLRIAMLHSGYCNPILPRATCTLTRSTAARCVFLSSSLVDCAQVWTSVQEWKEREVNWPDDPRKRPDDPWCENRGSGVTIMVSLSV